MKTARWLLVAVLGLWLWCGCRPANEPAAAAPPERVAPRAAEHPAVAAATAAAEKTREAAVAGLFYPKQPAELERTVDELLAAAKPQPVERLRGLVCPHAGYRFSGPVAATAYKLLRPQEFDTVIVLGPSHYASFAGASVADATRFTTPLGAIPVSPLAAELAREKPLALAGPCDVERPDWWRQSPLVPPAAGQDTPHTWEHSLEVQLPFLQRTLKQFSLVPIVFGDVEPEAVARVLAGRLDAKTLVVASSDLSHYHTYEEARQRDTTCVEAICRLNIEWMRGQEACGKGPILALMHLARQRGWKPRLLDCRNSGDTSDERSRVVGYAAVAFVEDRQAAAEPAPPRCSPAERKALLDLARQSLAAAVRGAPPPKDSAGLSARFRSAGACFVTLTERGQLRGCIGHIFPQMPLVEAVVSNAAHAALEDPRFPPVVPDEIDRIHIEISLLSVPQPLEFGSPAELLARLRPGVDGVVLRVGRHQATYLPQVWEQIPEKPEFLGELARKAGLPADAWKSPEARVLTYQVEAFAEAAK
jgi:hypothetical protein